MKCHQKEDRCRFSSKVPFSTPQTPDNIASIWRVFLHAHMQTPQIKRRRHIVVVLHTSPPTIPHLFFVVVLFTFLLCCVSVRSAAPDFHKLNEDGELWLVNQGLKETIRSNCVLNTSVFIEHDTFAFSQERMCAAVFHCSPLFSLSHALSTFSYFSLTSIFQFICPVSQF